MFAYTGRNRLISMQSLWRNFKNSKTIHNASLSLLHLSIHLKISHPSGDTVPFSESRSKSLAIRSDRDETYKILNLYWVKIFYMEIFSWKEVNSNTFAYVIKSATLAIKRWYPRFKNILDHTHTKDIHSCRSICFGSKKERNQKQKISFNLTLWE